MEMIGVSSLLRMMPDGYENACYATKAIVRKRDIKDPNDLMMLALFHLLTGCSLVEISEISKLAKLGDISDVAFMKRFSKCSDWFKWILSAIQNDNKRMIEYSIPERLKQYRILAVDASDVTEKGASGRIYRLQSVSGIEYCINIGCQYIARMRINSFKPYDSNGEQINLLEYMKGNESGELYAYARKERGENAGKLYPVRICFKKKPEDVIDSTRKKLKRKESKKQAAISAETYIFNEYMVVATSLDNSFTIDETLELYRYRWQVELYFKRLKSILDYGELPKKSESSIFSWLNGKLMIALLIEKMLSNADFLPYPDDTEECLEGDENGVPFVDMQPC